MVTVRLGVGLVVLFGALVGALVGARLEATLRKGGGWGWASSHFGKAVKGVTTEAVGRGPGRGVGWLPKLVLSKLPELDMAAGLHYLSLFFNMLLSCGNPPPGERLGKEFCPGSEMRFSRLGNRDIG